MAKKYRVVPIGTVLKNGTFVPHGTIVTKEQVDNLEKLLEDGFLEEVSEDGPSEEEKAEIARKKAEDKAAAGLVKAFAAYKKAFDKDAPADATLEEVQRAITAKEPIADLM